MHRLHRLFAIACCALALPGGMRAQRPAATAADSAQRVVQAFYRWYLPLADDDEDGAPWMRAIRQRSAEFSPELVAALRADSVASANDADEIVGLDGDPFLNAQDPCDSYQVRRARPSGDGYMVEVLGVGGCETHNTPDVIVEVARRDGRWVFVNFHYPGPPPDDLLAVLGRQRKDRGGGR